MCLFNVIQLFVYLCMIREYFNNYIKINIIYPHLFSYLILFFWVVNLWFIKIIFLTMFVVVIDLPLLRVAVEGSDNPVSLEKPCQASLPPDQQGRHSLGRHPEVQYVA